MTTGDAVANYPSHARPELTAAFAHPTSNTATWRLSSNGYGPATIGMTVDEAAAAMGVQLRRESVGEDDWECAFASFAATTGNSPVTFMTEHDRIAVVIVVAPQSSPDGPAPQPAWPRVQTGEGIGLGDAAAAVRQAYAHLERETRPYRGEPDYDLYVWNGPDRGMRFETSADHIDEIHAGNRSIRAMESCL